MEEEEEQEEKNEAIEENKANKVGSKAEIEDKKENQICQQIIAQKFY